MRVVLSNTSGVPLYEQVKQQVRTAILAGELAEGEALPSVRGLARDLQISVITTTRAYADLAAEGFIVNVPGKGAFVLGVDSDLVREQLLRQVEDGLTAALGAARSAGLDRDGLVEMLDTLMAAERDEGVSAGLTPTSTEGRSS
jgi:GntR family transcriptional regulator